MYIQYMIISTYGAEELLQEKTLFNNWGIIILCKSKFNHSYFSPEMYKCALLYT